ncbi:MAG: 2-oxoacid:acceptor oxidoreductase family protein [candidate division WOR-3 bacterium]|uniref:Pyruvate ferredoxin oxidoreductase n=1 Tax=candidate division WOR-3 bacterium TaxID=2052148 RepID=A0A7C1WIF1_UNCW3|nr:2-oxoacid:acceptor oxidoreductase family protein [candidate division WOR-3 bacterium]
MQEIKLSGFGGQGIIMMGMILGKAATLYDNKYATLTQSFGPEARGGACSAQLIISETRILYPYLTAPDILVAMSQEAYEKFEPTLKDGGVLILEQNLVKPHNHEGRVREFAIPATRIAESLGNRMFANMVMLGFVCAVTGIVPKEALIKAVKDTLPARVLEKNLTALEQGYQQGMAQLEQKR